MKARKTETEPILAGAKSNAFKHIIYVCMLPRDNYLKLITTLGIV